MSQRKQKYYRAALKQLKEERGPLDPELLARNKYRTKMVRAVSKTIAEHKVETVPEMQEKLPEYTSREIFLSVMYLMKYGGLKLINKRGDYPKYALEGGN